MISINYHIQFNLYGGYNHVVHSFSAIVFAVLPEYLINIAASIGLIQISLDDLFYFLALFFISLLVVKAE